MVVDEYKKKQMRNQNFYMNYETKTKSQNKVQNGQHNGQKPQTNTDKRIRTLISRCTYRVILSVSTQEATLMLLFSGQCANHRATLQISSLWEMLCKS